MADEGVMERNLQSLSTPPYDVHFQVSLLRLMYPGPAASTQVAALDRLREPAEAVPTRR